MSMHAPIGERAPMSLDRDLSGHLRRSASRATRMIRTTTPIPMSVRTRTARPSDPSLEPVDRINIATTSRTRMPKTTANRIRLPDTARLSLQGGLALRLWRRTAARFKGL